jgi:hypothetical protein
MAPVATIALILIHLAELDDVDVVLELPSEAAAWTAPIGFPNWPFTQPNGGVRHWTARLYERECNEEKRR